MGSSHNSVKKPTTQPSGHTKGQLRGHKVTTAERKRLCGVACRTLEELKEKGCEKLNIPMMNLLVQIQDGTIIEDEEYFQTLPAQTIFILLRPSDKIVTGADLIYNALAAVNSEYLRVGRLAQEFLSANLRDQLREFSAIVDRQSPSIRLSTRAEDPAWFAGLDTRAQTKEKFMFIRSQERIRGYFHKTVDEIRKSDVYKNSETRKILDVVVAEFRDGLKRKEDFGCMFDRSRAKERESLCDEIGEFSCEGRWNEETCTYEQDHVINPYVSREARVLFSTWNLDHGVERSRTVIPAILSAASNPRHYDHISLEKLHLSSFTLLFTRANLKLVHIVCHDKSEHVGFTNQHLLQLQKLTGGEVSKRGKQQDQARTKVARMVT